MTYLEHTSFDKQKKSAKNTLLSKIKVAIYETLYAQQYFKNFSVYYDIVDPTVRSTKKL